MSHDTLKQSVYKINTAQGSGSGFYLAAYGVVVTNFHVIEGSKEVALENPGKERHLARVIFANPDSDIAFLKADPALFTAGITFDGVLEVQNRDKVWVIGYPFGMPYTETEGIVSNSEQYMEGKYFIQIDAAVNPGNSGGPVVNAAGRLIGITTAKFTNADNMGFAIPGNVLLEDLDSLKHNTEERFAIKCNSCRNLLYDKTDYCPICGAGVNEHLFDERIPDTFGRFVEDALASLGLNPVLARTGHDYWQFYQGSSQIRIFVYNHHYLYAASPLNRLPSSNLESLYAYLLSDPVTPYKLGVYNNQIYLSYRMHISDIFSGERALVQEQLTRLPLIADEMDDFFVNQFDCEKTHFSREV